VYEDLSRREFAAGLFLGRPGGEIVRWTYDTAAFEVKKGLVEFQVMSKRVVYQLLFFLQWRQLNY
jgi:hypothetical protein